MNLKFVHLLLFTFLLSITSSSQSTTSTAKMILGNWKYDIAYDTLGVVAPGGIVDTSNTGPIFLTRLNIKRSQATLFDGSTKIKCLWEVLDNNLIVFHFDNIKSRTYQITSLTFSLLELKEPGEHGSTLGYKRK